MAMSFQRFVDVFSISGVMQVLTPYKTRFYLSSVLHVMVTDGLVTSPALVGAMSQTTKISSIPVRITISISTRMPNKRITSHA